MDESSTESDFKLKEAVNQWHRNSFGNLKKKIFFIISTQIVPI